MTQKTPIDTDPKEEPDAINGGSWLYADIGRLLGITGGIAVVALLALFASLGFRPALYLLLVGIAGVILIFGGGKIHQA